jgi:hypothetical protein
LRALRNGADGGYEGENFPFRPEIHHHVPDFASLHRKNDDELQFRKSTVQKRTQAVPFNFSQNKVEFLASLILIFFLT